MSDSRTSKQTNKPRNRTKSQSSFMQFNFQDYVTRVVCAVLKFIWPLWCMWFGLRPKLHKTASQFYDVYAVYVFFKTAHACMDC